MNAAGTQALEQEFFLQRFIPFDIPLHLAKKGV